VVKVPDDILIERVVGRRMDPETGKIYHVKYFPPPPEIEDRLTQRSDDNEEAVRARVFTAYSSALHAFISVFALVNFSFLWPSLNLFYVGSG
jgi:adenylate kinase family enzyme